MKKLVLLSLLAAFQFSGHAQKKWHPFAGLLFAMNADGYYTGLSYAAGATHQINKKKPWYWTPEVQYFQKNKKFVWDASAYEKSKFVSFSVRSNVDFYTGKKAPKGFFIGAGIGFQYASDKTNTYVNGQISSDPDLYSYELVYKKIMLTINIGYSIPLKNKNTLQFILSAIGPYREKDAFSSYTESISVLSSGFRYLL